jgi:hypothetical protein
MLHSIVSQDAIFIFDEFLVRGDVDYVGCHLTKQEDEHKESPPFKSHLNSRE